MPICGRRGLTTVCLVRPVLAVSISVALPVHVDALPAAALELAHWAARFLGLCSAAAALHGLVRLVLAVWVAVAAPQRGDALRVVAAELMLAAGRSRTLLFIAAVAAVIVAVTNKDGRHTLPVTALEITGGACLAIYRRMEKSLPCIM